MARAALPSAAGWEGKGGRTRSSPGGGHALSRRGPVPPSLRSGLRNQKSLPLASCWPRQVPTEPGVSVQGHTCFSRGVGECKGAFAGQAPLPVTCLSCGVDSVPSMRFTSQPRGQRFGKAVCGQAARLRGRAGRDPRMVICGQARGVLCRRSTRTR